MTLRSAILALLLCAAHAQARTLYVSTTGSHDTNAPAFSTWATAATNIQAAIEASSSGDTVRVAPGTYFSDNGTNHIIAITNKSNLSVIGGNGTLFDADRTILDAGGSASVNPIYVNAAGTRVAGFTAMNTKAAGAVLLWVSSVNCTLDSLIVRNNDMSATTWGSGIKNHGGPGNEIRNCIVVGNNVGSDPVCAGIHNAAYLTGVGICRVANCVVEANTKIQLYRHSGTLTLANTIYGNVGGGGTIVFSGGNLTSNTTNSVMQALDIAPASEGVGTNLVWRGVSAYIPRMGSLARKNGQPYAGIATASDGAGGPALVTSRPFLGRDVSTNRNYGLPVGGVTSAADSPFAGERSAAFDGASGYLDMGNGYNIGTNDLTLECWFKLNATASNSTFAGKSYYGSSSGRYAVYFVAPSTIRFYVQYGGASPQVNSIGWTPETGKWEHVAATWERDAGLTLYLNGASNAFTAAVNSDDLALSQSFLVGVYHTLAGYLNGSLSDLRIWSVARTPAEIQANYTNRLTGTEAGLVGYWPLDGVVNPIDTGPFNLDNPIIHPSYHEAF